MKQVVIVGYGGMGKQHQKLIHDVTGLSLKGVYDISSEATSRQETSGLHIYPNFESVIEDEDVDLIVIATPNHLHKDMAVLALNANKHVVCEKPVTLNSHELDSILEAEQSSKACFIVHQNRRWDEDYLAINNIYTNKLIGDVFHIETRVHGSRGIPGDWRKEKAYGGGMMLDWGVHLLDRILVMVEEKVKQVFCKLSYIRDNDVDDAFTIHLTFESGKTALVEVGTSNFIKLPLWYVLGTEGTVKVDDWTLAGQLSRKVNDEEDATPIIAGAGLTKTMAPRTEDTIVVSDVPRVDVDYQAFYKNVLNVMYKKEEPIVKNHQVMRVMKLMEAAFHSSHNNTVVAFE